MISGGRRTGRVLEEYSASQSVPYRNPDLVYHSLSLDLSSRTARDRDGDTLRRAADPHRLHGPGAAARSVLHAGRGEQLHGRPAGSRFQDTSKNDAEAIRSSLIDSLIDGLTEFLVSG